MGARAGLRDDFDWGSLVTWVFSDLQVAMVEAMRRIDQPLSAHDLSEIFCGEWAAKTVQHHLKRLVSVKLAALAGIRREYGMTEKLYRLTSADETSCVNPPPREGG